MNQADFNARVLEVLERLALYAESPSAGQLAKQLRRDAEAAGLVPPSQRK